ncbi:MAG: ABC transporter ATP-binding protein [Gallionellaceae bacterium CG11_big_fil_rev_8_21_14_0_20_60_62]|nr:MAG: ABC transporter ATP-binding protein [Gallionellaceae bacterium CG11_big_fil_rev_8_21_14_0_20_60_62]PIV48244.1 MAG: ABC transporter ATP-binding protein [Gallionellaceae bacterium CG02_land_8_20_14_3_00_60_115]
MLELERLVVRLRGGPPIVDGVSFRIDPGETFALLGESGCGKSMTALALMRLLPDGVAREGGTARMEGLQLFEMSEREMCRVRGGRMAMIFQEPGLSLNPVMTVGQQITEGLSLHRAGRVSTRHSDVGLKPDLHQRCIELLDQVGIPDAARRANEYPFQLSGGMKQRVMIAMALAGDPRLLIADEPTTALDVTIQAQVLQLLRETQEQNGMALLLITHDLGVVAENAHRVGVMYAGQLVEQASRAQLFSQPLHPYTQKLFAALPGAARAGQTLSAIPGNVPPLGSIQQGCRFAPRCDRAWGLCREQTPEWTEVDGKGVRCHLYAADAAESGKGEERRADATPGGALSPFSLSPSLLIVEDLQVHFPIHKGLLQRVVGQVKAVDGVSLSIAGGRTLALVGESGCGKTTLGKALLRLIPATAGSVRFAGNELIGTRASRAALQMVFQDPYASLNPKMRVAEILEEGMSALNIGADGAARQAHIDELLERVGLARDSKWRYPHEFSGGQRQRIAIARALAVSPRLLICDEPTSALDVSVQAQILNLLKSLQDELGLSYLFITHNLAVVEYLAHEVCVMYLGRIVERGSTADVMRAPLHPYTRALLSAVPRIDGGGRVYIKLEGDLPSPANPPAGCHFAPRCPQAMAVCATDYPGVSQAGEEGHSVHCHLYPRATI